MKKAFMCSLCRRGILGGALFVDKDCVTFRTNKLTVDETEGLDSYDLFELVGRKRGLLISGGEINHKRCADMLLDEFRGGKIGRITLEKPRQN